MLKVWGKLFEDDKIIKHKTVEIDETSCTFFDMLRTVCENLDVPTPVLLEKHVLDFNCFNFSVFKPTDFIQTVSFTKLIVENISLE